MKNLVIQVPEFLVSGERTGGPWSIQFCAEKLLDKYADEESRSMKFDRYIGSAEAGRPEFGVRDVWATHLMNSRISTASVLDHLSEPKRRARLRTALRALTGDGLEERTLTKSQWNRIRAAVEGFGELDRVGVSRMMKLLSVKRPKHLPMIDNLVLGALFERGWPVGPNNLAEAALLATRQFHALLHHGANFDVLQRAGDVLAKKKGVQIGPVRALESLVWFDWGGYRNWPETWTDEDPTVIRPRAF